MSTTLEENGYGRIFYAAKTHETVMYGYNKLEKFEEIFDFSSYNF